MHGRAKLSPDQQRFYTALQDLPAWGDLAAALQAGRYDWLVMNQDGEIRAFLHPSPGHAYCEPVWYPQYGLWYTRTNYGVAYGRLPHFQALIPAACILPQTAFEGGPAGNALSPPGPLPPLPDLGHWDGWL